MKKNILPLLILCFTVLFASAQPLVHPGVWKHLGAGSSNDELDFVKKQIKAGAEPWTTAYNTMKNIEIKGPYNKTVAPQDLGKLNENDQKADAKLALANAICWYMTDLPAYAEEAVKVLRVWSNTFNGYRNTSILDGNGADGGTNQASLDCAWIGSLFGPTCEILRNYTGWSATDMAAAKDMLRTKFLPDLIIMNYWNGNEDLVQIEAMIDISVFLEDTQNFNLALDRLSKRNPAYFYMTTDPPTARTYGTRSYPNDWYAPAMAVDGLTQETCRDNNHHAQFSLASALMAAEVAWHQGVDVYKKEQARYIAALELMAKQCVTGSMQGTCGNNQATGDRFDTFEIGYNHYHNRMGIDLPYTKQLLALYRKPLAQCDWNIFYETLTHADLIIAIDPPTKVTVSPKPLPVPLSGTAKATAVVAPTTASQQVTWVSRNPAIATVIGGTVTGVSIGSTYIVALSTNPLIADSTLCTVAKIDVTGITIALPTIAIGQGTTSPIVATIAPVNASNQTITWTSSNLTIATVSTTGVVTALKEGTAIITATTVEGLFVATTTVTVTPNPRILLANSVSTAITVDGVLNESTWILNKTIAKVVPAGGTTNNTSTFGVLWDNTNLYIGVKVLDATITTNNNATPYAPYNNDAIELNFDMNNNGGVYDAADRSWIKVASPTITNIFERIGAPVGAMTNTSAVKTATAIITGGYTMEFAIPWTTLGVTPNTTTLYGFDIGVDDADGGAVRASQTVWIGDENDWTNLTNVGDLQLLSPVVVPVTVTQTIQLAAGWNLISFNVVPADSSIAKVFAGVMTSVNEIKNAEAFYSTKNTNPLFNSLTSIEQGKGYLVNMSAAASLSVTGVPTAITSVRQLANMNTGWNLVGCINQTSTIIPTAFDITKIASIKNFTGFYIPNGTVNSITNIVPGAGYFVKKN